MRHNSFQKIYASYIAPNPEMDVLWMDLKADPYGSVIKFWNGGTGSYQLIASDASTMGKHIIYADGVELPVRSKINFKGFDVSDDQPIDLTTISVDKKEDIGVAQAIMDSHELEFTHSDIEHTNRAALNMVSGINTGDQDLSGLQSQIDEKLDSSDFESYAIIANSALNNKVDKEAGYSLISDTDKIRLSSTSGVNTGDQDLSNLVEKIPGYSLVNDSEISKLAGVEEGANNYIHPATHPASILDVVDAVDGSADKFLNELGEMVEVSHEIVTDKNSEASVQHVDTTVTKETLADNDKVALYDSESGKVVLTPNRNLQGMKLLADYTINTNIVLPQIQSIDYETSTFTFTAPHGFIEVPYFHGHACCACINDYTIKTNYKAVPSGLQQGILKIVEIISPTVLRFSIAIAGTNYVLPNAYPVDVNFSMWHFEYIPHVKTNIIIENSVAIKVVVMARSQYGQSYISASGNETSNENPSDVGNILGLGTAYFERTFFIGGNGLLVSRTLGKGNTIRSAGLARIAYDTINTWRYEGITYINRVILINYSSTYYGNGTRILVYKLA